MPVKWKNVHLDIPPEDGQMVLLSADGVYYLSTYDAGKKIFRLKDQPEEHYPVDGSAMLYWLEFENPSDAPIAEE